MIKKILIFSIIFILLGSASIAGGRTWIKNDKTIRYFLKNNYKIVHIDYIHVLHSKRETIYFRHEYNRLSEDSNLYRCILYERLSDGLQTQQCYQIN